jgi:hypothetical protein
MIGGKITYHIGSDKYASSTGFHLFTFNNEMLVWMIKFFKCL